jgi:hypothetical protein
MQISFSWPHVESTGKMDEIRPRGNSPPYIHEHGAVKVEALKATTDAQICGYFSDNPGKHLRIWLGHRVRPANCCHSLLERLQGRLRFIIHLQHSQRRQVMGLLRRDKLLHPRYM